MGGDRGKQHGGAGRLRLLPRLKTFFSLSHNANGGNGQTASNDQNGNNIGGLLTWCWMTFAAACFRHQSEGKKWVDQLCVRSDVWWTETTADFLFFLFF